jgi:hypothetical protein
MPSSRYVGLNFVSYEGEVPNTNGLRMLDWGCVNVVARPQPGTILCQLEVSAWYVTDAQGPMLWIATRQPGQNVAFTVQHTFDISPVPPTQELHFAESSGGPGSVNDASTIALVRGVSDSSAHWTDIVAAWTISSDGTTIEPRSTIGFTVLDACAVYRTSGGKQPGNCTES